MRLLYSIIFLFSCLICSSQSKNNELIILAEVYHKYHCWEENVDTLTEKLNQIKSAELQNVKTFIAELVKTNNDILNKKFLSRPDTPTLKSFFIIKNLNYNMFSYNPHDDNDSIIYRLDNNKIDTNEFLVSYYKAIFVSVLNKNRDFDYFETNFDLDSLNLKSKKEKAIFFLVAIEIINPFLHFTDDTTSPSLITEIRHYPTFNRKPFYVYKQFDFEDFKLTIDISRPKESFKDYYLQRYLNTIQYYLSSLIDENEINSTKNK